MGKHKKSKDKGSAYYKKLCEQLMIELKKFELYDKELYRGMNEYLSKIAENNAELNSRLTDLEWEIQQIHPLKDRWKEEDGQND